MSTYIGIGFSKDPDTTKAALDASEQAKKSLHSSNIDIAIVLNTAHYDPSQFIPIINEQINNTKLIGSSTAAILFEEQVEKRGIAILLMYSDEIRFETGSIENIHLQDLYAAGTQLTQNCISDYGKEHRKLFLFFADGLIQELSHFIAGITANFGGTFPIVGAGSIDNFQFKKTYQYFNNNILNFGACSVLLGGRLQVKTSCRHGWRPLGRPRIISESESNLIKSIDQKPAAHIYQEFFANTAETLRASSLSHLNTRYPLGTPLGKDREYLLRNVLHTLDDDSIVLQDGIGEGKQIHLMIGNKESCLSAADDAAFDIKTQLQGQKPKLILIFESLTRHRILGRAANSEIQRIKKMLGDDVPIFGMYCFGEVFTYTSPEKTETLLQNESIIITAIC